MLAAEKSGRALPLRDASQRLSREAAPIPGLVSRHVSNIPDDFWAAYRSHPMAYDLQSVNNNDDFLEALEGQG